MKIDGDSATPGPEKPDRPLPEGTPGDHEITATRATPEVIWREFPAPLRLYARDSNDSAMVPIAGVAPAEGGFDTVRADLYRNGAYWKSVAQPLVYDTSGAPFSLAPTIYAGPTEYGIKVYLTRGGTDTLIGSRDSIVCGDVIMIAGQSNSVAGSPGATYSNEFCRTFGVHSGYDRYDAGDTAWGLSRAVSTDFQGRCHVGVWGLRLQRLILERFGIPTCVISGGVAGSSIQANQRNDNNPEDRTTIYGRTLYRARRAGAADQARALFWYQGEANGIEGYYDQFRALHEDWRNDYPGLRGRGFYIVQIRPGCSGDPTHGMLRELQRTIPDSLPGIVVISTAGIPGHDGCHYTMEGYNALADQALGLLARDLYGSDDTTAMAAPNIRYAYYTSSKRDEIAILFRSPDTLVWPEPHLQDGAVHRMEDQFFLDEVAGNVHHGAAIGNRIILTLTSPSPATRLGYIPPVVYTGTSTIYEGPWITNRRGVGAPTFNNVPIYDSPAIGAIIPPVPRTSAELRLRAIAPNPFSDATAIHLLIYRSGSISVALYNMLGERVRFQTLDVEAGPYTLPVPADDLPSGIYYCCIGTGATLVRAPLVIAR